MMVNMHFYGTVSASLAKYRCNSRQGAERRACWRTGSEKANFFCQWRTVFARTERESGETALHRVMNWNEYAISLRRRESSSGNGDTQSRSLCSATCAWGE